MIHLLLQAPSESTGQNALMTSAPVTPADFWLPEGASTFAPQVDFAFQFVAWISYFFFVLVVGLMIFFAIKYRQKGREAYARGPSHHTMLELGWTIIPTILCVFMFWFGFRGFIDLRTPPQNSYQIDLTAQKWAFNFRYPTGAASADQNLYIPVGRPVKLVMRSEDVLHAAFIPAFRVKHDIVPGRYSTLWFQSDHVTEGWNDSDPLKQKFHHFFCAEYCGKGHSGMYAKIFVLPQADFDLWLEKQGRWMDDLKGDELWQVAGPKLFGRCASCHSLNGSAGTGPSWQGLWARASGGAGSDGKLDNGRETYTSLIGPGKKFENPESYVRNSILNPGDHIVVPYGNVMPTFRGQLNDLAIDAIIGMMKNLDKFDAKGKYIGGAPIAAK